MSEIGIGLFTKDFRDKEKVNELLHIIKKEADPRKQYNFMEVCGSHTMAVSRFGIRGILPKNVHLISGPGCPVCVTPQNEIDAVFDLLEKKDVMIATFGDMLRVPGSRGRSLEKAKAAGADVRIVFSPMDALKLAMSTEREIVFIAIGFETTAPACAALVLEAYKKDIKNLSIFAFNKTMGEVMSLVLSDKKLKIDGFLCPGHVTAITGLQLYNEVVESRRAAVVTGFEPVDILVSIVEMIRQVNKSEFVAVNKYGRVVKDEGNPVARGLLNEVFDKEGCWWRGIGFIEDSGLALSKKFEKFDAVKKFGLKLADNIEIPGCRCGEVLKGYIKPSECGLFGKACTPDNPVGPCMVSSEGACAAYYKYGG